MTAFARRLWMFVVFLPLTGLLQAQSAWLGIDAESSGQRITITEVLPNSPAKRGGLRVGDVITSFQGKAVKGDLDGLALALSKMKPQTQVRMQVLRGDARLPIKVILGTSPSTRKTAKGAPQARPTKVSKKVAKAGAGRVRPKKPGTLGVGIAQQGDKIWVENVNPRSAAQRAGFKPGDQIVSVGGKPIKDVDRLVAMIRTRGAGNKLTFIVRRQGKTLRLQAVLGGQRPAKPSGVGQQRRVVASSLPTKWFVNFETARTLAKQAKRPLLVDFYADWCGPCKLLEKSFKAKGVVPLLRRCILVRVDVDKASRLADRFGVQSIPRVLMLSPEGKTMGSFTGYLPPDELSARLSRFLGIKPKPEAVRAHRTRKGKAKKAKKASKKKAFKKKAKRAPKPVAKNSTSEMERLRRDYQRLLKRQRALEERLKKLLKMLEKRK